MRPPGQVNRAKMFLRGSSPCILHPAHVLTIVIQVETASHCGVGWEAPHTYSSFKYHKKHFHFIQMHFIILLARVGMFSPIPTASTTGGGTSQANSQFFVRQVFETNIASSYRVS